jgi:arylsulfatase A-like enzyme
VHGQVGNIDFAPTLVAAAGARAGRRMDGVSLLPTLASRSLRPPRRAIAVEALARLFTGEFPVNAWDRPYHGVRTDRYTYVVYDETGEKELYDRQTDAAELRNVAGDPVYAATEARLANDLTELRHCRGAVGCAVAP